MKNSLFAWMPDDSYEEFVNRVLTRISIWGFDSDALVLALDKCADTTEQLDMIENCLNELSICSKQYICPETSCDAEDSFCREQDILKECGEMLWDLYAMRNAYDLALQDPLLAE